MNEINNVEIAKAQLGENKNWRLELKQYLSNPSPKIEYKLKHKALKYALVDNESFKRSQEGLLPIGTRKIKFDKWSPNWEGPFIITQVIYSGAYKLSTFKEEELAKSINRKYLKKYYPMIGESINIKKD